MKTWWGDRVFSFSRHFRNSLKLSTLHVVLLLGFLCFSPATAQDREQKLRLSAANRDLKDLLSAIDTRDNGNHDVARIRALMPSGMEPESLLQGILHDDRVRKIYALLKDMPREQASEIVAESYNGSLNRMKRLASSVGGVDQALAYGLHAKLWLSFEFQSKRQFNRNFASWNDWYVDRLVNRKYLEFNKNVADEDRKNYFARTFAPELLAFLSLVLNDQAVGGKDGDQSEFAKMLREAA